MIAFYIIGVFVFGFIDYKRNKEWSELVVDALLWPVFFVVDAVVGLGSFLGGLKTGYYSKG